MNVFACSGNLPTFLPVQRVLGPRFPASGAAVAAAFAAAATGNVSAVPVEFMFSEWTPQPAYTNLLRSATLTQTLTHGKQIHAHLLKALHRPCLFLLNNLLNFYSKCGDTKSAHKLFDKMPQKDTVSWNSLISASLQTNNYSEALSVFAAARKSPVKLDKFTYSAAIGVCSRTGDISAGRSCHGMVVVSGLYRCVFLTNSLIDMYSKCGDIEDAKRVFDSSDELDDVSWNTLISAFVRIGRVEDTFGIFYQMHRLGVPLNAYALGSVLKCCSSFDAPLEFVRMVHGCVVKSGLDLDVFVGSAMIGVYAQKGLVDESVRVFRLIPDPNVVVFNAMIAALGQLDAEAPAELKLEALGLFSNIQRRGIRPSKFTFSSVLSACNLTNAFEFGKQIHGQVFKANLRDDEFIGSALIDLYSNSGSLDDGLRCFRSASKQDVVTWTSMISGCIHNEHFEKALSLFRELLAAGRRADHFTLSSAMSACANLAVARTGEQIQSYLIKAGFNRVTICGNSQIFMYARSGDIDAAVQTFRETENCNVISWSAMISSHAQHGCARDALVLFEDMEARGVTPNHVTFLGLLTACSHGGLVDEGFRYFEIMKGNYGINPNAKHCACIVDLLGRCGRLADAENFIMHSGFHDDPVMWRALLGSCRIHGDTERGKHAAERLMELEPSASSTYVLLYNMFLDSGRQSLATKARDLMKERGVKKEPGLSWIEIRATVHSFVAGDKTHPESQAIYAKLEELMSKLKNLGYTGSERKDSLLNCHSEKLAVALGMMFLPESAPIRVMKNLRVCRDCHTSMKLFSEIEKREIVLRDPIRFHRFRDGICSCGDYW